MVKRPKGKTWPPPPEAAKVDWQVGEIGLHGSYGFVRVLEAKTITLQHLIVEQVYQSKPRTRWRIGGAELRPGVMEVPPQEEP